MQRWGMVLGLLGMLAGCDSGRPASTADAGAVASDSGAALDGETPRDSYPRDAAAPRSCTSLAMLRQVSLEFTDTMKLGPQIAFDGERFAVVWHSQPSIISSLNGELRFALVDAAGKTSTPDGVKLGSDNGTIAASLVPSTGKYAVLHLPLSASAEPGVELREIDATGQTRGTTTVEGLFYQAAMSAHPAGHALFLAAQAGSPELLTVDGAGLVSSPVTLISAEIMASLWLAPRIGGFVAASYTANSNGNLFVLGPRFEKRGQTVVGHGAGIKAPSFAVLPDGFAAIYAPAARQVESEVYDAEGTPLGHHTLATSSAAISANGKTALVWSGEQLFATYPGVVEGQYVVQILDRHGAPVAKAVPLPNCLATAAGVSAAWGGNQLAIASINEASGVMKSSVCVTLMECL